MRSVPSQITDGFTNHYTAFWVVKVEASGGVIYYWTSTSKNRTGHTFTLKWDATTTVTPDSGMIASRDLATGEEYDGIGAMESGVDISEGGAVASVSDLEIQILNQENFHDVIIQASINIENRPITIYFGFIPDGSGQTVVISTQMLKRWAGVVEEVMDYDYQTFILRCVDGSYQRHKAIPTTIINKTDYPRAPKESVGKPLPMVYGDFSPADEETPRKIQTFSACPTILIDAETRKFIIAEHILHTLTTVFIYSSENNLYGKTTSSVLSGTTAPSFLDWSAGGLVTAEFYQQLKTLGTDTDSGLQATFPNAVDEDLTNIATLNEADATKRELYGVVENPQNIGTLISFKLVVLFGTITGTVETAKKETPYTAFEQYTAAHNDTEQSTVDLFIGVGGVTSLIDQYGVSVTAYGGATAEIKNMFLNIKYFIANFARMRQFNPRGLDYF